MSGRATVQDAATALFRAVAFGHRATVKLLVDRGADLEAKDCVSAGTVCAARRIAECGLDGPGREAALGGMSGGERGCDDVWSDAGMRRRSIAKWCLFGLRHVATRTW